MRSLISHLAVGLFVIAVGTTGAYAASGHHDHDNDHGHANAPSTARDNGADHNGVYQIAPSASWSRLSTVLHELRVDDQRLDADHINGRVGSNEYARLKNDEARIRTEAVSAADRNSGAIPADHFAAIQYRVHAFEQMV